MSFINLRGEIKMSMKGNTLKRRNSTGQIDLKNNMEIMKNRIINDPDIKIVGKKEADNFKNKHLQSVGREPEEMFPRPGVQSNRTEKRAVNSQKVSNDLQKKRMDTGETSINKKQSSDLTQNPKSEQEMSVDVKQNPEVSEELTTEQKLKQIIDKVQKAEEDLQKISKEIEEKTTTMNLSQNQQKMLKTAVEVSKLLFYALLKTLELLLKLYLQLFQAATNNR